MRTISYACDGCGKTILSRSAVKININIQRGADPAEKKGLDFCTKCFLRLKTMWEGYLGHDDMPDTAPAEPAISRMPIPEPVIAEPVIQKPAVQKVQPVIQEPVKTHIIQEPVKEQEPAIQEHLEPVREQEPDKQEQPERVRKQEPVNEQEPSGLKLGPIGPDEKQEIFRLYIEEGLTELQIAERLNRLPRGIKRAINSASKSGELDAMKAEYAARKAAEEQDAPDAVEAGREGSGASDARMDLNDSYVVPPQKAVIMGKRYDVGGVLALARAGWNAPKIAEERHYDVDVVRVIIETYLK